MDLLTLLRHIGPPPEAGRVREIKQVICKDDLASTVVNALEVAVKWVPEEFRATARLAMIHGDPAAGVDGGLFVHFERPKNREELAAQVEPDDSQRHHDLCEFERLREKYGW